MPSEVRLTPKNLQKIPASEVLVILAQWKGATATDLEKPLQELQVQRLQKEEAGMLLVFPEYAFPESTEINSALQEAAQKNTAIIVAGFEPGPKNEPVNKCRVYFPTGEHYDQIKLHLSPKEEQYEKIVAAHAKCGKELQVFVNTPIGDFAVLVCYDFTSVELLPMLWGKVDHLIIPCRNEATSTFQTLAGALAYSMYAHYIICNYPDHGESYVTGPGVQSSGERSHSHLRTIGGSGNQLSNCLMAHFGHFQSATNNYATYKAKLGQEDNQPEYTYRKPPAGYVRDRTWYAIKELTQRTDIDVDERSEALSASWSAPRNRFVDDGKELGELAARLAVQRVPDLVEAIRQTLSGKGPTASARALCNLNYLWDDIKELKSNLDVQKPLGPLRTGGTKFTDGIREPPNFLQPSEFACKYSLSIGDLEAGAKAVAEASRRCFSGFFEMRYSRIALPFNTVSRWVKDKDVVFITPSGVDKSQLTSNMIVAVKGTGQPEPKYPGVWYEFDYTCLGGAIHRPSQETPFSYAIHLALQREWILHPHPVNILAWAWLIEHRINIGSDMSAESVFLVDNCLIPCWLGRNVKQADLFENLKTHIDNKKTAPPAFFGLRHGVWIIQDDFDKCLTLAEKLETESEKEVRQTSEAQEHLLDTMTGEYKRWDIVPKES
ncbi:MAG: class II aldolase/adducin family protein [Chloroflexi bacterium]|nr:class II aldolase/adducin family protein [Chloroflexota bacterium]